MNENKGVIEMRHYPKGLVLEPGVSSGIRAKRCGNCHEIFFTNDSEFKTCSNCKE